MIRSEQWYTTVYGKFPNELKFPTTQRKAIKFYS